ncbi:TraB/TrbI/VirB10 family type IV secretion system protein [Candidatus Deianiraea vastatrix]|uniref:Type IV secretion system protein VirB10 n=1 Tax=Candidatus Deianiraea vastatrix TaxID=2163644 RepID=A0A5B8XBW5_9RICK|nr:TrbI/VirB10 family protein [Candidatus Deianiraea vastatrix]QED22843.1 Type IV secretion system protein VirB10 [Candidatus Deianiraea vastatrix]
MQAKKDNTPAEDLDEEEADSSGQGAKVKKAKIKRMVQIILAILGVVFMLYNVVFSNDGGSKKDDGGKDEESQVQQPPDLPQNFAKDPIPDSKNKSAVAPKEIQEFDAQSAKNVSNPSIPSVSAPDVPPLPDFNFSKPELIKDKNALKDNNTNITINNNNQLPPPPSLDMPKMPDPVVASQPSSDTPVQNPDVVVEAKKKEMFAFSNGNSSGSQSSGKKKESGGTGEKDFIIYDTSKLVEVSKNSQNPNATITTTANLENTIGIGKMMDVVLETAINSQLPGPVRGIVSRDVFAEAGAKILIPKGTRVYGTYSSTVTRGQSRLNITWSRVIRPDGVIISMSSSASDQFGRAGIEGDVDNRYSEIFSNSILLSFVTLGAAIALEKITGNTNGQTQVVNSNGSVATSNINPINMAAQSVISNTTDIVNNLTNGAISLAPIVTLPQGTRIKVIVNQDIVVPDYKKQTL